jgi:DNA-binding protein HU-beta
MEISMAKAKNPALITPGKGYTRTKLTAHLTATAEAAGASISKKAMGQVLEELVQVILANASVGASLPGLGKAVIRKIKARPARIGRNPMTGESIKIKAKPAGKKLVFRFAKAVKDSIK